MRRPIVWLLALGLIASGSVVALVSLPASRAAAATTYTERESGYVAMAPVRLVDTRSGVGITGGPVRAGRVATVKVTGMAGVPSTGVSAVTLNVTVTGPSGPGFLTVFPAGIARPSASNLNFDRGSTRANQVWAKVGAGGSVALYSSATTHVVVDLAGYYPSKGAQFTSLAPARLLDTRTGLGAPKRAVAAQGSVELTVAGRRGVPGSASGSVVLNVTVTRPTGSGFATAFPTGQPRPNASNLNYAGGQTVAGLVLAKLGDGGRVTLYTSASAQLVADVAGYFPAGSDYAGLQPSRLVDTRTGLGVSATRPVRAGESITVKVVGAGGVPIDQVTAASVNVTSTRATASGYVTAFPTGAARPTASMLNFSQGRTVANSTVVKLGADGAFTLYSSAATELVVDVGGFLSAPLNISMEQPSSTHVERSAEVASTKPPSDTGAPGSYTLVDDKALPAVGDHVYLPPGGTNGAGIVGRVTGTDGSTVEVVSVPLQEVFPSGHIEGTGSPTSLLVQAAGSRTSAQARGAVPVKCSGSAGPKVSLVVQTAVRLAVLADWGPGKTSHFKVTATVSTTVELTAEFEGKATCSWEGPKVPGPVVAGFTTTVGPKVSLQISDGIGAVARWSDASYTVGFEWWAGGGLKPISHLDDGSFALDPPQAKSIQARAEVNIGPAVELKLGGVAGVELTAGGFLALTVAPYDTPWWVLSAGAKVAASFEVDVLFIIHAEYEIAAKVLLEVTLAESQSPYAGPPPSGEAAALAIPALNLPLATVGQPYSATLQATGGRLPYSWTAQGLPDGLLLDPETGELAGSPASAGTSSVAATVTDATGARQSRTFSLTATTEDVPELTVEDFVLKPGTVGVAQHWYLPSYAYGTRGGTLSWTVRSSTLPAGIKLYSGAAACGDPSCGSVLRGTPTDASTSSIELTATSDAGGTSVVRRSLVVSAQPQGSRARRLDGLPATYDFTRIANDTGGYTIVRTARSGGARLDVLATAGAPAECRRDGITWEAQFLTSSPNGRYVMFPCLTDAWHLYVADLGPDGRGGSTRQVDRPDHGYASSVSADAYSFSGDINDAGELVFLDESDLTPQAAVESTKKTTHHAYTYDWKNDSVVFLPMQGYKWQAFRRVQISEDGDYLYQTGTECSGPDGGYCGEGTVVAHANPLRTGATVCVASCVFTGEYWGVEIQSVSKDGQTLLLHEEVPKVNPDGKTYTNGAHLTVWRLGATITRLQRWDYGNGSNGFPYLTGAISSDGSRIYYTDNLKPYTCDLVTSAVSAKDVGPATVVDTPEDGLPRTGCSQPWAVDGSNVYAWSTNTNFFPTTFGTLSEDVEGYVAIPR